MQINKSNAARFRRLVRSWGRRHSREYPWRRVDDTYAVLLSEMMLRRTRADQVVPVYELAAKRYPTARDLASADPEAVKGVLRPLGLEWRAGNIITMAREVADRYGGEVPSRREDLMSLTGVGTYVASAVACFSSNHPAAIVDTNVVRVVGRVFGLRLAGEARRRKEMIDAVELCLDVRNPRLYNYALLDFAALVCTARKPRCGECPFGRGNLCEYYRSARAGATGTKPRKKRPSRKR